jgi:hypothetical protein
VVEETTREKIVQDLYDSFERVCDEVLGGANVTRGQEANEFKPDRKVRVQEQQFICGEYCN